MSRVLVTGATGNVGRPLVSALIAEGARVRALSRNPDTAALPSAAEVVRGDLTDPASLDPALDGIDVVFLLWTAAPDAAPAAIERIARHVPRIVLLTSPHQTPHPFFQQPNPLRAIHQGLERLVERSGAAWTFLRPGMFAANALSWWGPQLAAGDVIRWPYGDSPTAPLHERDLAAVAVRTLLDPGHESASHVLTGPESLTHREQVAILGEVLGRPLRYEELTPDQVRREWPVPRPVIDMLLDAWAAALGQPAHVTQTVAEITGRPARTFREWAIDHRDELTRKAGT